MITIERYFGDPTELSAAVGAGSTGERFSLDLSASDDDPIHITISVLGRAGFVALLDQIQQCGWTIVHAYDTRKSEAPE